MNLGPTYLKFSGKTVVKKQIPTTEGYKFYFRSSVINSYEEKTGFTKWLRDEGNTGHVYINKSSKPENIPGNVIQSSVQKEFARTVLFGMLVGWL